MGKGVICLWYLYVHWSLYILIRLTVSNGAVGHLPLVSIFSLVSIYSYSFDYFKWERGPFAFGISVCIGLYIFL